MVAVTVDVEEEGLFRGRYERHPTGFDNLRRLERLAWVGDELGLPLTLLATYPVVSDDRCRETLLAWRDDRGAELGAHLHPWCTPPFDQAEGDDVLRFKMAALLDAHQARLGRPARSFRMGRFAFRQDLAGFLAPMGVWVDSSLLPLSWWAAGQAAFGHPVDPWPLGPGVLEAPLTLIPILPSSDRAALALARRLPTRAAQASLGLFQRVGLAGVQPTMFSLGPMCVAARLHLARGGRAFTLFLHSSELMPGGSPQFSDQAAVDRLLLRLRRFLTWLKAIRPVQGMTLSEMAERFTTAPGKQGSELAS